MKQRLIRWVACALTVLLIARPARPCSTIYVANAGRPVCAKNYDWMVEVGLVMVNKRDVVKLAMVPDRPATWKSKYGSVTFNQYGREFPMGGMNEAGLVVEQMWLDATTYPAPDDRRSLNVLQWVQYQLDTAATVQEVIASDKQVRINPVGGARCHFLIGDRHGHCATIEFIGGELVCHSGSSLPVTALTNDTYEASLAYLKQHAGFGGTKPVERPRNSLDRFVCAADMLRRFDANQPTDAVASAWDVLAKVAQGEWTKWSIVYDIPRCRIYFRTQTARKTRCVDLKELDFSCETPVMILDINRDLAGDVTGKFVEYSLERNRALINKAWRETPFLKDTPETLLEATAAYPNTCLCEPVSAGETAEVGD